MNFVDLFEDSLASVVNKVMWLPVAQMQLSAYFSRKALQYGIIYFQFTYKLNRGQRLTLEIN